VHLEFFPDGIAGIARAKYELIEALPRDGVAVLNFDDAYVAEFGKGLGARAVYYGMGEGADVRAVHVAEVGAEGVVFTVEAKGERASVQLKMLGRHNVPNALAAIAVGLRSGMGLEECAAAVGEMRAGDKRGEVLEWRGAMLINDCYNSNPTALNAMVDALMAIPAERHIVVAGEMLELGPEAEALHAACGSQMAEHGADFVLGVRGLAKAIVVAAEKAGAEGLFVGSPEDAGAWLVANVRAGDVVLLKASRGVRLEKALTVIGKNLE
jgi:UDP-N-acetylmuramoyl-tripeptide--D-alanyl-D-alanine ligase